MLSRVHIVLFVGTILRLKLGTFNGIFGFPPSMDLPNCQVPVNSIRMHFGANFPGVLGTTLVH